MLEVPQALLDERRARGADRWDEMGVGELQAKRRLAWEGGTADI